MEFLPSNWTPRAEYNDNFYLMRAYPSQNPNDRDGERSILTLIYEPTLRNLRTLQLPESVVGPFMQEIAYARASGLNVLPSLVELSGHTELPELNTQASHADRIEARRHAQTLNSHFNEMCLT